MSKSFTKQSVWTRLYKIKHDDPKLNKETWFTVQPCAVLSLFGRSVVITQPSSTFWVYLLGVLTTVLGIWFYHSAAGHVSRALWGVSLVFWGVGALVAGTSYQAFGYQLKCAGRDRVVWTSWWEVIYLLLQQYSVSLMLVAVAYSCLPIEAEKASVVVALTVSFAYTFCVAFGAFKPIKALITFELMVHVCTPLIIFMLSLNVWRYYQFLQQLDLALIGVWLGLIITMVLYHKYSSLGLTEKLWKKGRWFSENDVLHVALIIWVIYLAVVLEPLVSDLAR